MQSKICTLLLCLSVATIISPSESRTIARRCIENKSYFDGCNTCTCTNEKVLCTRSQCGYWDSARMEFVYSPTTGPPEDFWHPIPHAELVGR